MQRKTSPSPSERASRTGHVWPWAGRSAVRWLPATSAPRPLLLVDRILVLFGLAVDPTKNMQFPRLLCSGDWSGDTAAASATEVSCRRQPFQRDRRARLSSGCDGGSRARCVPRAGGPQALGPKEGGARPRPRPPASSRPGLRRPALSLPTTTVPTRAPPDGEQRPPTPLFPEGTLAADRPSPRKLLPAKPGPASPSPVRGSKTRASSSPQNDKPPLLTKIHVLCIGRFYFIHFLGETSFPRQPRGTQTCCFLPACD